ncbi:hypothetical protein [Adhaeribacter aerolatus]|uniref:hypothetical protein n=1 Tax=Adhaeribacter aerolatus TaxID=670289 RepID=UPI0011BE1957|nr:hypothetical protein [Adhaeribacter aerolatus]
MEKGLRLWSVPENSTYVPEVITKPAVQTAEFLNRTKNIKYLHFGMAIFKIYKYLYARIFLEYSPPNI